MGNKRNGWNYPKQLKAETGNSPKVLWAEMGKRKEPESGQLK